VRQPYCNESSFETGKQNRSLTDLSRFQHPRFTRMHERISAESERRGAAKHRDRALAGLTGQVIEIGADTPFA
jgi:hypothetical protein